MGGRAGVSLDGGLVVVITIPNAGKMRLETNSEGRWKRWEVRRENRNMKAYHDIFDE